MNATARRAFDYYVAKGVPPQVAAAIVGNLFVESGGFAPDVLSGQRRGDNGQAWYAPQLRGARKAAFDRYAAANNLTATDLETQLAFVLEEMDARSPYRDPTAAANRDHIFAADTVDEATRRFMTHYERPNPDANINHISRRIAAAHGTQNFTPTAGGSLPGMLAVRPEPRPLSVAEANAAGDATMTPFAPGQVSERPAPAPGPGLAALAPNGLKGGFSGVGKFKARGAHRVDPRLVEVLQLAADQTPGYRVEAFSGFRPGDKRFHGKGAAVDVRLVDMKTGKELPNYQNAAAFREYEKFAQTVRKVQMERHPDLARDLRWGGYFSGKRGKYGALDTMHFDLGGRWYDMAGGSWEKGLTAKQRAMFPGVVSEGMTMVAATPDRLAMLPADGPIPAERPAPAGLPFTRPPERAQPVVGAVPMPAERNAPLAEPGFFRPPVVPGSDMLARVPPFSPAIPAGSRDIAFTPPPSPYPGLPAGSQTIASTPPPALVNPSGPAMASAPSGGIGSALGGLLSGIASAISAGMAQTAQLNAQGQKNFEDNYRRTLGPGPAEIAQQMPADIQGEVPLSTERAATPFAAPGMELTPEELVASLFGRPVVDREDERRRKPASMFG